ncbi:sarcosine oxidase subunit gamma [Shimia abyssi]|uniref:Sarcosine oxidase subunit gamma n=1 Tax=Shimia abyssi TaxID=1662395 RepID=A0A2P8FE84_9RHOB|nr:sarcosine oxidase subunit gamma [Shimia abyssi]PSL20023.1 sarcosine oxidase subunit gamma [Shimia abyssi]
MAEMNAKSPCDGLLPIAAGDVHLSEIPMTLMTSISPFKGQTAALSEALKAAHGMALPAPNRATGRDGARVVWIGREQVMLIGPEPAASLEAHGALTDQSDAWAVVRLYGEGAEDVLARLVPVDLRAAVFKRGHTVRTMLQHMSVSITRVGDSAFQIMAFRSMAKTLVHEVETAMKGVAARDAS